MSKSTNSGATGGVGVTGLLQVALIVLKLCEVIDWSWWWVLTPTWGVLALVLLILLAALVVAVVRECKK